MKIDLIAGARPNFMKISPIIDAIKEQQEKKKNIMYRLIHTGQHYDHNMSSKFFEELSIPFPDINLEAGGGSQSEQTAKIMIGYEKILNDFNPDYCLVVGDVTSTMACSIVAKKNNIKVMHVEGGIRSFDLSMPEEINRMVTDSISDYFYTTSEFANDNLIKNGIDHNRIVFVGNTMIDTLIKHKNNFMKPSIWSESKLNKSSYFVMTLHRPSNVDELQNLIDVIQLIEKKSKNTPIIFPAHPRTANQIKSCKFEFNNLIITEPLGYLEFNYLVKYSLAVITDSGGITEEATVMNIPCITLRENTERPETVSLGTNVLVGSNPHLISKSIKKIFSSAWKKGKIPPLWDGKAAKRIIKHIIKISEL